MQAFVMPRKEESAYQPYEYKSRRTARYPAKPLEVVRMMIDHRHYLSIEYKMNDTDIASSYMLINNIKAATMYSEMGYASTTYQVAVYDLAYPVNQVYYFNSEKYVP